MAPKKKPPTLSETISVNVREARLLAQMSQEEVAQGMKGLGFKWTRMTVTEVEGAGRGRQVSIEEWLGLAEVFRLAAFQLLLPQEESTEVTIASEFSMEHNVSLFAAIVDEQMINRIAKNSTDLAWKISARVVRKAIAGPLKAMAQRYQAVSQQAQELADANTALATMLDERPELWLQNESKEKS